MKIGLFLNGRMQFCDYLAVFVLSSVFKCSLALLGKLFSVLVIQYFNQKEKFCSHFLAIVSFQTCMTFFCGTQQKFSRMSFSVFLYSVKVNEDRCYWAPKMTKQHHKNRTFALHSELFWEEQTEIQVVKLSFVNNLPLRCSFQKSFALLHIHSWLFILIDFKPRVHYI